MKVNRWNKKQVESMKNRYSVVDGPEKRVWVISADPISECEDGIMYSFFGTFEEACYEVLDNFYTAEAQLKWEWADIVGYERFGYMYSIDDPWAECVDAC